MSLAALLPGCDAIYELLGMGGETEAKKPEQPEPPPPPTVPMADGGEVSFTYENGQYYEVHVFTTVGESELAFLDAKPDPLNAWILVVGGGGGGSAGHRPGNGGGAGGVAEHTGYSLMAGSYSVTVGAGGTAVTSSQTYAYQGNNGGNSSFGVPDSDPVFVGYGGGGGGGGYYGSGHGRAGGSSGGSGDNAAAQATKGEVPFGGTLYGNAGAVADRTGNAGSNSQGGGGAGGPGQNANGGPGIESAITGYPTIYAAGGGSNVPASDGEPGTGNGGRQAGPYATSYAGGSGVVIVRFPYTAP